MTSKLKCPVCPYCCKPLHCGAELNVDGHNVEMWYCTNYACEQSEDLIGTRENWELVANRIQARQDLEIAREALTDIFFICEQDASKYANARISEIYAIAKKVLEHKE